MSFALTFDAFSTGSRVPSVKSFAGRSLSSEQSAYWVKATDKYNRGGGTGKMFNGLLFGTQCVCVCVKDWCLLLNKVIYYSLLSQTTHDVSNSSDTIKCPSFKLLISPFSYCSRWASPELNFRGTTITGLVEKYDTSAQPTNTKCLRPALMTRTFCSVGSFGLWLISHWALTS